MNKLRIHPGQSWGYQQCPHIWCSRDHLYARYHDASRHQSQIPIRISKKVLNSSLFQPFNKENIQKHLSAISQALPFDRSTLGFSHGTRPGKFPLPRPRLPRGAGVGPWGSMLCRGTAPWNGPATGETWRPSWTWSLAWEFFGQKVKQRWYSRVIILSMKLYCQVCVSECESFYLFKNRYHILYTSLFSCGKSKRGCIYVYDMYIQHICVTYTYT